MSSGHSEHGEQHTEHVVPVSIYVGVFLALLVLTGVTTGVAYIDLGAFNTVVALIIAFFKMMLVVLFFMHVRWATGLTRILVLCGFFWLAIMITFTLSDELTRSWEINPASWGGTIIQLSGHIGGQMLAPVLRSFHLLF
jgi:cytochrome c oxidase subunit 4